MLRGIQSEETLSFVRIEETYPDEYILVKIAEIDYSKGKETGTVLGTSNVRSELVAYVKTTGIQETIILEGSNLAPILL